MPRYGGLFAKLVLASSLMPFLLFAGRQSQAALPHLGHRSPIEVLECTPIHASGLVPPAVEMSFKIESSVAVHRVEFAIISNDRTIGRAIDVGTFAPGAVITDRRSSLDPVFFRDGLPPLRCVTDSVVYVDGSRWHQ